jgi:catechol 2,3-dioxygenase-like lactoylglutathione lyase family enzyme
MKVSLSRATIFCKDVEISLSLYQDILGLVIVDDKTLSGPAAGGLLGLASCKLRIILLSDSGDGQPIVGLFGISEADMAQMPAPPQGIAHGQAAIVFQTTEFDEIRTLLESQKYRFLSPPVAYPKLTASPGSPAGLYKEMIFYDPDGNLLSVMQIIHNS